MKNTFLIEVVVDFLLEMSKFIYKEIFIFYFKHCKFPSHVHTGNDSATKQFHFMSNSKMNNVHKLKFRSLQNEVSYFNVTVALHIYYFIEKDQFKMSIVTTKTFPSNFYHHDREQNRRPKP